MQTARMQNPRDNCHFQTRVAGPQNWGVDCRPQTMCQIVRAFQQNEAPPGSADQVCGQTDHVARILYPIPVPIFGQFCVLLGINIHHLYCRECAP